VVQVLLSKANQTASFTPNVSASSYMGMKVTLLATESALKNNVEYQLTFILKACKQQTSTSYPLMFDNQF